ncbi:bifunctional 3,4-dihydroxy-2-butanone-4-phosphate synthase/GTP cyclohydrolase II [Corynebacterium frankenforstense]|uniref:bifunctional 3,4-dihydroxy-2-butanone-4-phosphate synthase/GTP cyclohydrolase II n=1 Tax=Corynebacterium TaxID=1716 RepID=UPI00254CF51C|nr:MULTISPECIES: bifunctional 3,4-dihydroxy-2-butanone-4-phosphate synthase/GTP cyclohydrolase II [Corynebacterium]MDK6260141.1 bifunctional 3,4-dihydroxy-2-butanone-4-phosphate synthase/GTP cyclohydrolase II [Corynebacterium frankenforstense]MDK8895905.1 bifunctional 3,4-dihydroxy-2-butanone-4-phosphate synthase/GTP cyclohydrolase II [Corynebacterium sp. MSK006]
MTDNEDRTTTVRLDSVEDAIADIAAGKAVVVVDNEDRENEGDLIFAAEKATPELVAFMVRYTSGYICAPVVREDADRLHLPPMVALNEDARGTAYTVTVDAATGSTGISATSRAETLRRLADPKSTVSDFTRPGHVVPLRAREGGVLERDGHTEASIDLARAAGLRPVGALCEIVSEDDPTDMARGPELRRFADAHGLHMISIAQLIEWRRHHEVLVERVVETRLPTDYGYFRAIGFCNTVTGFDSVALIAGEPDQDGGVDVPVRVHSECLTGDVFGSRRCDCGQQLDAALRLIQERGRGIVIYLRGQEGRGIGLMEKLRAYRLQDFGLDTVDANLQLGHTADSREYSTAAQILRELGIKSVNLMSNNPAKVADLTGHGVEITGRTRLPVEVNEDNVRYLRTKRDRMGHDLPAVADWDAAHPVNRGE